MQFYKISSDEPAVSFLVHTLKTHLKKGEKVLWLVTGGSGITLAAKVAKQLAGADTSSLYVTLTDERFVPRNHPDSNWKQLTDAGFLLPGAQLFPVLNNEDMTATTKKFAENIQMLLNKTDYKIGLFGMGPDGHVAALFPSLPQINDTKSYALSLSDSPKPPPLRITIAPPAIKRLNEAVIFAKGDEKRPQLEKLNNDIDCSKQPAQILKVLAKLTIFNDQIGEKA
jgi:6-phosphogluconolactonase